jgi:UDP-N-acetylmuramate--alanine ligase
MAKNIQNTKSGTKFDVQLKYNNTPKREVKNFFVPTHGKHNINNALSAITVTSNLGVDFQNIKIGLKNFKGVKRRLSFINNVNGVSFYDDYAHHPTEIQATLSALKILKKKRIISIVQPHRYSRLKNTFTQFCNSFDKSNITLFLPVYAAGEKTIGRYNSKYLAESIKKNGKKNIYYCKNAEELENFLINNLRKKDLVVFMGAGNISKMAHEFVNKYIRLNK